jgi:glycosyltransferase involved in cell wall biosynthesis
MSDREVGACREGVVVISRLRIGIIAPEFPPEVGGMQTMALQIALHIAKSHEVVVCTRGSLRTEGYGFTVLANLCGKTNRDLIALNRIDVDVWLAMNAGYVAIAKILHKPLIAYFHGNDFLNPWVVSTPFLLRLLSRFPVGSMAWSEKRRDYARKKMRAGVASALKILTNSSNTKSLICQRYPHQQDVVICPPGVNSMFFQNYAKRDVDTSVLTLLTVSRLEKATRRKNIEGVLRALALLKTTLRVRYSIVGDGDDRQTLTELSDNLSLSDCVTFLGRVSDEDLLELYRKADLFVLPAKASPLDVEGFGIVYLEANACGVPVLCSAAGGATDAVIDGQTGIVLESAYPDQIAEGILRFARFSGAFKTDQLRSFASNFTWEIAAARIEAQILSSLETFRACGPANLPGNLAPNTCMYNT